MVLDFLEPRLWKLSLSGEVSVFSSARYGQLHQLCNFNFSGVSGGRGGVFPEREEIVLGGPGCCLSSFWLSRRHLLRLQKLFQIAAGGSSTVASNEKGPAISPAPCYFVFRSMSLQRDPAAATKTGVPTFTLICFGLASSRFGMLSVSTPF